MFGKNPKWKRIRNEKHQHPFQVKPQTKMSIKIMSSVWDSNTKSAAQRLVLLRLADHADTNGECWPSQANIAEACGLTERSVRAAISGLEEDGHISIKQRTGKGNRNSYNIHPKFKEIPEIPSCISGESNRKSLPEIPEIPSYLNRKSLPIVATSHYYEPSIEPSLTINAPRIRNELLDALAIIDGSDIRQITQNGWKPIAKALKDIKSVCPDLTAEEINRRAAKYRIKWPTMSLTPLALAKYWAVMEHKAAATGFLIDSNVPTWQQVQNLKARLAAHPGNDERIGSKPTDEQRKEFFELKKQLPA